MLTTLRSDDHGHEVGYSVMLHLSTFVQPGVGVALGRTTPVRGALLVLVANMVLVVAASAATLWVQRSNQRRRAAPELPIR